MLFDVAAGLIFPTREVQPPTLDAPSRSETKGLGQHPDTVHGYMDEPQHNMPCFPLPTICGPWNKVFKMQLGFLRSAQGATATGSIPTAFGPPNWH